MDDDLAGERKLLGTGLPERRHETVDDPVREQPAYHPSLTEHRGPVALAIPAADREAGDQVVQDEVVENDEARLPPESVNDPPVGAGVVSDVVDADVDPPRPRPPPLRDANVKSAVERRQQERAVISDPRP